MCSGRCDGSPESYADGVPEAGRIWRSPNLTVERPLLAVLIEGRRDKGDGPERVLYRYPVSCDKRKEARPWV